MPRPKAAEGHRQKDGRIIYYDDPTVVAELHRMQEERGFKDFSSFLKYITHTHPEVNLPWVPAVPKANKTKRVVLNLPPEAMAELSLRAQAAHVDRDSLVTNLLKTG